MTGSPLNTISQPFFQLFLREPSDSDTEDSEGETIQEYLEEDKGTGREKPWVIAFPVPSGKTPLGESLAGTWWRPICRWVPGNNSFSLISFQCWVSSFPPRLDFSPPDKTVPPELSVSVSLCTSWAQRCSYKLSVCHLLLTPEGPSRTERCLVSFAFSRAFLQELKP